jgi:long-chain acyl-CoA synthetase
MSTRPSALASATYDSARTIVGTFWRNVDHRPAAVAIRHRVGSDWVAITWSQYGAEVRAVACGLRTIGVGAGDRVAILADNRFEWHVTDIATMSLGAISVPIYATSSPSQVQHALLDSGSSVVVVDSADQLAKVQTIRSSLATVTHVIAIDPVDDQSVCTWSDLHHVGTDHAGTDRVARDVSRLDQVATIVYTSGTTGTAKGAALTHRNVAFTVGALMSVAHVDNHDRFVSFLPLSHIAERVVSHFGQIAGGAETWFARSVATVAEDLHHCRPTIFFAVPRIWEKLRDAIEEQAATRGKAERTALRHYLAVSSTRINSPRSGALLTALAYAEWAVLDRLVGVTLRRKLGLDKARMLVSGAAPINPTLLRWFLGIGLPIVQAYGQTEDCGPVTLGVFNDADGRHIGSVGRALPGVELAIARDGELLVRGDCVCAGYWNNVTATSDLIDNDKWMHTGDLGRIDGDGFTWIVGRKKDLIILAAGHKVVPEELESRLRIEPLILEAVVVGEGRPYLTALITLNPQQLAAWAKAHHKLFSPEALAGDADVHATIAAALDKVNAEIARSETIKQFRILPTPFTAADGELTPTAKVKRNLVIERNDALIDAMYAVPVRTSAEGGG